MRHGQVTARPAVALGIYLKANPIGELAAAETGFRSPRLATVRTPDIAYTQDSRVFVPDTSFGHVMPDLVVETISPGDTASEVAKKTKW